MHWEPVIYADFQLGIQRKTAVTLWLLSREVGSPSLCSTPRAAKYVETNQPWDGKGVETDLDCTLAEEPVEAATWAEETG